MQGRICEERAHGLYLGWRAVAAARLASVAVAVATVAAHAGLDGLSKQTRMQCKAGGCKACNAKVGDGEGLYPSWRAVTTAGLAAVTVSVTRHPRERGENVFTLRVLSSCHRTDCTSTLLKLQRTKIFAGSS